MAFAVILIAGLLGGGGGVFLLFKTISRAQTDTGGAIKALEDEVASKTGLVDKLNDLYGRMVDVSSAKKAISEVINAEEGLRSERGRITITQAELETVETRLRELEEIERELEASGLETKEELNILQRKQGDLKSKNDQLQTQIRDSTQQWDQLIKEMEENTQVSEKIQGVKTELVQTENKIGTLLIQIEEGNDQYFILKKRYDALDIEYAQLYEKFTEAEAMVSGAKGA